MKKCVMYKRVLSFILTLIIVIGMCDWTTFMSEATAYTGDGSPVREKYTQIFYDDHGAPYPTTLYRNIDNLIRTDKSRMVDSLGQLKTDNADDDDYDRDDNWSGDYVLTTINWDTDGIYRLLFDSSGFVNTCLSYSSGGSHSNMNQLSIANLYDGDVSRWQRVFYDVLTENSIVLYVSTSRTALKYLNSMIVCSYNFDTNMFNYHIVWGQASSGNDDDFGIELWTSSDYWVISSSPDTVEYNKTGIADLYRRLMQDEVFQTQYANYLFNLRDTIDSKYLSYLKLLDKICVVGNDGSNVTMSGIDSRIYRLDSDNNEWARLSSEYGNSTSRILEPATINIDGNNSLLDWSSTDALVSGVNTSVANTPEEELYGIITATSINMMIRYIANSSGYANIDERGIEGVLRSMAHNREGVAFWTIAKYYASALKTRINDYSIAHNAGAWADTISESIVDFSFRDDFNSSYTNLLMGVVDANIASLAFKQDADKAFENASWRIKDISGSNAILLAFGSHAYMAESEVGYNDYCSRLGVSKVISITDLINIVESNSDWEVDYIKRMYTMYLNGYKGELNGKGISALIITADNMVADYNRGVPQIRNDSSTNLDNLKKSFNEVTGVITSGSILNVAAYCDVLAKYIVASSLYYSESSSTDDDILEVYNQFLAEQATYNYYYESTKGYFPTRLPGKMSLFGNMDGRYAMYKVLGSGSDGCDWDRLISLLMKVDTAFAITNNSEAGIESGYTVDGIKSSINGTENENGWSAKKLIDAFSGTDVPKDLEWVSEDLAQTAFGGKDESIYMIKAIVALANMVEFLGIDYKDWSPDIIAYLDFWYGLSNEERTALKSNPRIKPSSSGGSDSQFSVDEPLGKFFSINDKSMSEYWNMGFALSSTYVPMETNIYDATTYAFMDNSIWMYDMIYKYGFYRKALYISTDNNAVNNQIMTASTGSTRVATFSDLLNYDRDIILYVDSNFYNARDVSNIVSKLDYASIRNTQSSGTEDRDLWTNLKDSIQELFDLDTATVLKTAGNNYYSSTLYSKCTKLNGSADTWAKKYADFYLLDKDSIVRAIDEQDEYTVQQSFAVVSAIYRSDKLFNVLLQSLNSDNAVFKSSKSVCANPASTREDWLSVYNYYMLANLESQMKNDAASSLDVDAPIFVDIFGNILTESGLVIIPAAANPTIVGDKWDPYTVAFPTYYYNGNMIQPNEFTNEFYEWLTGTPMQSDGSFKVLNSDQVKKECGGGYFALDSGGFTLRSGIISSYDISALVNFEQLQKNAPNVKQLFYNHTYYDKTKDLYSRKGRMLINLIVEVLRGAPIEYIDYEYEGLEGNVSIGKYGVYLAFKLEELIKEVLGNPGKSGNSMVTMPNLAFMDGIEYIVLYVFKVAFAVLIVGLVISLYFDAVQNKIGFRSVGKFIFTCVSLLVSITLVPNLISWSYYKANKELLKDEVGYVMMLEYSKDFDGAEIGITKISTPESNTEFYIKLDDVSLDWWSIIYPVLFTNTYETVSDLYRTQLQDNLMAMQDNVVLKADGLYINTMDIYNSTTLQYQPSTKTFVNYNYAGDSNVTSFVLPYYVILDQLVGNINVYNNSQLIDSYSYSIGSNGHICTYGLIAPYFSSNVFLEEGYDILGLHYIHQSAGDISGETPYAVVFAENAIERMKMSEWYSAYTGSITNSKIESLYTYARDWIARNRDMMGKVPDEVFLKVFAMQMAVEYNNIFGIADGNSVEIMNVDTRDIMRFMVGDKANVYKYYSYSFSRYVYEQAGTLGVIMSAIFLGVLWITSFLKPLLMLIILAIFIVNIIGRRILFRRESKCFEGYLIGCACLCLCNYIYAGMLKISIMVADYGFGSITSLGLGIVIQVCYTITLFNIAKIEVKDWKNNGFYQYANSAQVVVSGMTYTGNAVMSRLTGRNSYGYGYRRSPVRSNQTGRHFYNHMHRRDRYREERAINNIQAIDYAAETTTF